MSVASRRCASLLVAVAVVLMPAVASAAGAADSIKIRQALMASFGANMGALGAIAKGEAPHSELAVWQAGAIAKTAGILLPVFPEGSGTGETAALPAIWQDWAKFEQAVAAIQNAAPKLIEAAKSGDAGQIGAALGAVGKTCGGCHDAFRKKHDHDHYH